MRDFEIFLNRHEDANTFYVFRQLLEATGRTVTKEKEGWKIDDSQGSDKLSSEE